MSQVKTSQELLQLIYTDFALVIREYCYFEDLSTNEIEFFGQLANAVHKLPQEDFYSESGRSSLLYYLKFLEETVNQERIIQPVFLDKFHNQISVLKEFLQQ